MSKVFIALLLVTIATVIACGGGGGDGPRMTVEEYAAACEEISNKFDDEGGTEEDLSSVFNVIENVVTEIKQLNPPEELQEFHETRIRSLSTMVDLIEDSGFLELMRELEEASEEEDGARVMELMGEMAELGDKAQDLENEMAALEAETERTEEALSPATRQILADADCLSSQ